MLTRDAGQQGCEMIVWVLALTLVVALGAYNVVRLVRSWRAAR
jgi:hypothetical protein